MNPKPFVTYKAPYNIFTDKNFIKSSKTIDSPEALHRLSLRFNQPNQILVAKIMVVFR